MKVIAALLLSVPLWASAADDPISVHTYCEKFARRYSADNALEYQERSASARQRIDVTLFLSNLFQPEDSKFTAEYVCRFRAGPRGEGERVVSVEVLLTRTLEFAKHTQWNNLQIIPIEYVTDEARDRAGYAVLKYLDAG